MAIAKYTGILKSGYHLYVNETLISSDGLYLLKLQEDGDLVVLRLKLADTTTTKDFTPEVLYTLWSAGLKGKQSLRVSMEENGNFVVYADENNKQVLWSTGTKDHADAVAGFADDGRLAIFDNNHNILWKSTRNFTCFLKPGETMYPGDILFSASQQVQLKFQTDGNLVAYYTNYTDDNNEALWDTNTAGKNSKKVVMQGDGNLCMYGGDDDKTCYWNSGTSDKTNSYLICMDDGVLYLFQYANPKSVWNS